MNRADALKRPNRSDVVHGTGRTPRRFAWNRAHWIGMVVLAMVLLLLQFGASAFAVVVSEADREAGSPDHFIWLTSMMTFWPLAMGLANLILGLIRTGSLSFPLASTLIGPLAFGWTNLRFQPGYPYLTWPDWWALMRADGLRLIGQTLSGMGMLLVFYTTVAFICYAIGRYGLRELFVDPDPLTLNGRMLAWVRRDTIRFGCWLATAIMYGLLLTLILDGSGPAAFAFALLINFVVPPALLVINGIYALRPDSLTHPWRSLLFPLVCTLVPAPMLMALITVYEDTCPVGSTCTLIGDRYLSWNSIDQVAHFVIVFAVASLLGFGVVWAVASAATRIAARRGRKTEPPRNQ